MSTLTILDTGTDGPLGKFKVTGLLGLNRYKVKTIQTMTALSRKTIIDRVDTLAEELGSIFCEILNTKEPHYQDHWCELPPEDFLPKHYYNGWYTTPDYLVLKTCWQDYEVDTITTTYSAVPLVLLVEKLICFSEKDVVVDTKYYKQEEEVDYSVILKEQAAAKALKIKSIRDGLTVWCAEREDGNLFIDSTGKSSWRGRHSLIPAMRKDSVTWDTKYDNATRKYTSEIGEFSIREVTSEDWCALGKAIQLLGLCVGRLKGYSDTEKDIIAFVEQFTAKENNK